MRIEARKNDDGLSSIIDDETTFEKQNM